MGTKTVTKSKKARRKQRARKRLAIRRGFAVLFIVCAIALGVLAAQSAPSLRLVIWGIAAVLMLGHAALLAMKRPLAPGIYALTALACILLALAGGFSGSYVLDDGRYVPESTLATELRVTDAWPSDIRAMHNLEVLDMRDSTVTDFSPLVSLTSLRQLDARGNAAFTQQVYDAVAQALPDCEIYWDMVIGGQRVDSDASAVDLTGTDTDPEALRALFEAYPDKQFSYEVSLMGRRFPTDATALDLTGAANIEPTEINEALSLLPGVTEVDLRGAPVAADTIAAITDANPGVRFMFSCAVPAGSMTTEDAEVTLPACGYEDLLTWMSFIDYMPNLTAMDARAVTLDAQQLASLQADPRSAKLIYNFTAFGRAVSTLDTELNLDDTPMTDTAEVERCLAAMPNLTRVSMCNCGLSYEQMAALCDRHPNVKFIWWVSFGHYKLRTDATAFTTNLYASNKYNYTSATFAPLQYCTDLMMLDIGHCKLTSIEGLAKLTKLRVLILADNRITDISPLAGLEDLEYVELFLNKITDFSPLANKAKLVDLNIYYNPIRDVAPICTCTSLQRLWVGECGLSSGQLSQLRKALPNAKIVHSGSSSTGNNWRKHSHYYTLKQMYKTGQYIPFS